MSTEEVKCDTQKCCPVDFSKPLAKPHVITNEEDYLKPRESNWIMEKCREFFKAKGFIEVFCQNRATILSSCESPSALCDFNLKNTKFALQQTNQMILEDMLLKDPSLPGLFTFTASYRDEKNPIPERHNHAFLMCEFEFKGDHDDLKALLLDAVKFFGFKEEPSVGKYADLCEKLGVKEIEAHEEGLLAKENPVYLITDFTEETSPFFNMKRNDDGTSQKIDVILDGWECMGTAVRSCDKEMMRKTFSTITDGEYAKELYRRFGKDRVDAELENFLAHDFFGRSGGAFGINRCVKKLQKFGLMPKFD